MADAVPLIGPEQAALMRRRVSVIVATRDAANCPHLMRAIGARLSDDLRSVTLFLSAHTSRQVLDDLRANRRIAVVFSEPTTHRTVQLKGCDAEVLPLGPGDDARVARYIESFAEEIGALGFAAEVARAMFAHRVEDLVAVRFTPDAGYDQTPGPAAGRAIGAAP